MSLDPFLRRTYGEIFTGSIPRIPSPPPLDNRNASVAGYDIQLPVHPMC